jgi:hypothetical protein
VAFMAVAWLLDRTVSDTLRPFWLGVLTLIVFWMILRWLHRNRIFIRI